MHALIQTDRQLLMVIELIKYACTDRQLLSSLNMHALIQTDRQLLMVIELINMHVPPFPGTSGGYHHVMWSDFRR